MGDNTPVNGRDYELQFEYRPDFLVARVSGEQDSVAISLAYGSEIVRECQARKYKRVLVVEKLKQSLSITDTYTVASQWSQLARGLKSAFVDLEHEHQANNIFGEHVAANRGLIVRLFNDMDAAEQWLLQAG